MENFTQSSNITIIIPARYGSSRLEGKPLLKAQGKSIIQWVYEKAKMSKFFLKYSVKENNAVESSRTYSMH